MGKNRGGDVIKNKLVNAKTSHCSKPKRRATRKVTRDGLQKKNLHQIWVFLTVGKRQKRRTMGGNLGEKNGKNSPSKEGKMSNGSVELPKEHPEILYSFRITKRLGKES